MATRETDPLAGTDRLLIDGSNLLHALARAGGRPALPAAAAIGRLRAAIAANVGIELVLDGAPDPGMKNTRVASGLIVRYSGRRSGDHLLLNLVDDVRGSAGGGREERRSAVDNLLVVTDDRELRTALQQRGVRTAGTRWLIGRLDRPRAEAVTTGNRRPPAPELRMEGGDVGSDDDRPRWRPGRGATVKRGNPKRGRRPPPTPG